MLGTWGLPRLPPLGCFHAERIGDALMMSATGSWLGIESRSPGPGVEMVVRRETGIS